MNRLPSLSALRAFEAAARLSSFKKAAEELSVTPTAVSHRVRLLEQQVGQPLFVRTVRAVALTDDGRLLLKAVGEGFQMITAAVDTIREPRRTVVTLSATPAFAAKWLIPRMADWQHAHPEIDLHVHATHMPVDLDSGMVDLAIRYGNGPYPAAVRLLSDTFAPMSGALLGSTLADDPARWPLIHFDWFTPPTPRLDWEAWAMLAGQPRSHFMTGIRYSEESHAIQATVAGQGVALLSALLVEQELKMGLLQVVAGPTLPGMSYYLLKPVRKPLSEAAQAVAEWLMTIVDTTA